MGEFGGKFFAYGIWSRRGEIGPKQMSIFVKLEGVIFNTNVLVDQGALANGGLNHFVDSYLSSETSSLTDS